MLQALFPNSHFPSLPVYLNCLYFDYYVSNFNSTVLIKWEADKPVHSGSKIASRFTNFTSYILK